MGSQNGFGPPFLGSKGRLRALLVLGGGIRTAHETCTNLASLVCLFLNGGFFVLFFFG